MNFAGVDDEASRCTIVQIGNLKDRESGTIHPLVEERLVVLSRRFLECLFQIGGDDVAVGVRRGVVIHRLPEQRVTELVP